MLKAIRGRAGSWVVKGLFILLALSFVAWGVEGFATKIGTDSVVVTIGSTELDSQQFAGRMDRQIRGIERQLGGKLEPAELRRLGVYDQGLERVINDELFNLEAERLGIVAGNKTLDLIFRSSPGLIQPDGAIDAQKFAEVVRQSGFGSAEDFIKNLRTQVATSTLQRAISSINFAPPVLADQMAVFRFQKRKANYIFIADEAQASSKTPSDSEISAYYTANAVKFTAPEYRQFSYATISLESATAEVKLNDADIKAYYDENLALFTKKEQRSLLQLLFDDETAARKAFDSLSKTTAAAAVKAFQAYGAKIGTKPDEMSLGTMKRDDLPETIAASAFSLKPGEISQPIKSEFGWSLILASKILPETIEGFDSVRDKLKKDLTVQKATDLVYDRANRIESAIDRGTAFDAVVSQYGLRVTSLPELDQNGIGIDGEAVDAVANKTVAGNIPTQLLMVTGFALKDKESSPPLEIKGQVLYFLIHASKVTPPTLRPLETVRAQVVKAIINDQQRNSGEAKAKALLDKAKGKQLSIAELAAGTAVKPSAAFTRDGKVADAAANDEKKEEKPPKKDSELPKALVSELFKSSKNGNLAMTRSRDDRGWIVAQVSTIETDFQKDPKTLLRELTGELQGDLIATYSASLKNRYKVKINQKLFDQLYK